MMRYSSVLFEFMKNCIQTNDNKVWSMPILVLSLNWIVSVFIPNATAIEMALWISMKANQFIPFKIRQFF